VQEIRVVEEFTIPIGVIPETLSKTLLEHKESLSIFFGERADSFLEFSGFDFIGLLQL